MNLDPISEEARPEVLIVDDSLVERSLYVQIVRKWGYSLSVASSGEEALEILSNQRIQLVLADWHMPGMSGVELCSSIRKLNQNHYVYVILMSAQQAEEFLINALQSGADDVLTKPVDTKELEARLKSAERRISLQQHLRGQNRALTQGYELIAQDLKAVSKVQRSYLPELQCQYTEMSYRWLSVPSQYVSGDHLNVFRLTDEVFGFYVLDVSGHGIPAAVKSMQLVQVLADFTQTGIVYTPTTPDPTGPRKVSKPRDVVARLNELFQQTETDLSYFTLVYGHFVPETGEVVLCQAGHPSPLILRATGEVEAIDAGGYPVGLFEMDEFEDQHIKLLPGDSLLLYSDGVTEVLSETEEQFGEKRLKALVQDHPRNSAWSNLPDRIVSEIAAWGGDKVREHGFEDDVSLLLLGHGAKDVTAVTLADEISPVDVEARSFRPVLDLPGATHRDQHRKVVVVDDSRSFLRIFEAMLTSWGYQVFPASNAHQALALVQDNRPDFVLTDWDMPGMSGIELCEQIRQLPGESYIYVIMITGFATRDDLLNSLRVGADDFLTKPVNPSELKVRLNTAQRVSRLHAMLASKNHEISGLYQSLRRDMREVARIQRSLLPKDHASPWPVAIQGLYRPRSYVSGKQFGLMKTLDSELGFFMLNLPGSDTATALHAMALARWFSMSRATDLLFPAEEASLKVRRYLADPESVWQSLKAVNASVTGEAFDFDLLYGLLNIDQGTLLVAAIGRWEMVVAMPEEEVHLLSSVRGKEAPRKLSNGKYTTVLYQDLIKPGSRIFAMPQSCADFLNLTDVSDWERKVIDLSAKERTLGRELARIGGISNTVSQAAHELKKVDEAAQTYDSDSASPEDLSAVSGEDLSVMAFQWREFSRVQYIKPNPDYVEEVQRHCLQLASNPRGIDLVRKKQTVELGHFRDILLAEGVMDPFNVSELSNRVREFVIELGVDEVSACSVDLALSEAMTNLMNHAFKGRIPEAVSLMVAVYQHAVIFRLLDRGFRIPESALASTQMNMDHLDTLELSELPEGGMGLKFMGMTSTVLSYRAGPQDNELTLLIEPQPA